MYDPHAGHRPPALQGLPTHHSPHMSHAAAAATVGMHGYHSGAGGGGGGGGGGHGTPSHVSPVANHVMGSIPEVHKRDKDAIYRYVHQKTKTKQTPTQSNRFVPKTGRRRVVLCDPGYIVPTAHRFICQRFLGEPFNQKLATHLCTHQRRHPADSGRGGGEGRSISRVSRVYVRTRNLSFLPLYG